ncbi:MAG: hypothetical protein ACTSV1_04440 [Alphaproteobacteria bacterium]
MYKGNNANKIAQMLAAESLVSESSGDMGWDIVRASMLSTAEPIPAVGQAVNLTDNTEVSEATVTAVSSVMEAVVALSEAQASLLQVTEAGGVPDLLAAFDQAATGDPSVKDIANHLIGVSEQL